MEARCENCLEVVLLDEGALHKLPDRFFCPNCGHPQGRRQPLHTPTYGHAPPRAQFLTPAWIPVKEREPAREPAREPVREPAREPAREPVPDFDWEQAFSGETEAPQAPQVEPLRSRPRSLLDAIKAAAPAPPVVEPPAPVSEPQAPVMETQAPIIEAAPSVRSTRLAASGDEPSSETPMPLPLPGAFLSSPSMSLPLVEQAPQEQAPQEQAPQEQAPQHQPPRRSRVPLLAGGAAAVLLAGAIALWGRGGRPPAPPPAPPDPPVPQSLAQAPQPAPPTPPPTPAAEVPPAPPPTPAAEVPPAPPPAPVPVEPPPPPQPPQPERRQDKDPPSPTPQQEYRKQLALAQRLLAGRKPKDAAQIYRQLLSGHPNAVELHVGLGACALRTEHFIQATQHFRDALARKPRHATAILGLADAYRLRGDHAHALEQYRAYLALPGATGVKAVQAQIARLEGAK